MKKRIVVTLENAKILTGIHYTLNHTGKMEGMASLSTSCTMNPMCKLRSKKTDLVCSHCYAQRQMKIYHSLDKCLIQNTNILTKVILADDEIPFINKLYFRFESFGDLINTTQVINYFNICKKNKNVMFAIWTKNPGIIDDAIKSGANKPSNLQIVLSSPKINSVLNTSYDFIDKIFTVYDKDYIIKNNININCGNKKCISCGKCYQKGGDRYINEKLK